MRRRVRLTEGRLRGMVHEAVKRVLWEVNYNPFDNDDFDEWEAKNVADISDEEYEKILDMDPLNRPQRVFDEIGFEKWNGFLRRLREEDPSAYDAFCEDQMAF